MMEGADAAADDDEGVVIVSVVPSRIDRDVTVVIIVERRCGETIETSSWDEEY